MFKHLTFVLVLITSPALAADGDNGLLFEQQMPSYDWTVPSESQRYEPTRYQPPQYDQPSALYPKEETFGDPRGYRETDPTRCYSLLCD